MDPLNPRRRGFASNPPAAAAAASAADPTAAAAPFDESSSNSMDDDSSLDDEDVTWISWFCSLKGHEFFAAVDEEFIADDFNLTGLAGAVPYYSHALDTILDDEYFNEELSEDQLLAIEAAAELLYGLIHARFIVSTRGLALMRAKFDAVEFGRCPRMLCEGQPGLPVGVEDAPRKAPVRVFCPRCWDVYLPRSKMHSDLDGAYWGSSFPHLFCQAYEAAGVVPRRNAAVYTPRIFGFKIHESAPEVQRNRAMADEPEAPVEPNGRTT